MTRQASKNPQKYPKFLLKSTMGVALVGALLVIPFILQNLLQQRWLVSLMACLITALCVLNAYHCSKGRYDHRVNLFGLLPALTVATIIALERLGMMGSYWAFPTVLAAYFILPIKEARLANVLFLVIIGPVAWFDLEPAVFARFYAVLIGTSIFAYLTMREIYKQHYQLHTLSTTDVLTGLNNRALLKELLEDAIHQKQRQNMQMSLMMIDIDHFKQVNDIYGHDMGDDVLKGVADLMRTTFRQSDTCFRMGGEEFLVLLMGTDVNNAQFAAERFRQAVEQAQLLPDKPVTVSIGLTNLEQNSDWKAWVKTTDERLYQAKQSGRNRVIFA